MVTLALYNITDTFWLSKLGHEPIASLTVILPYQIIMMAVGIGSGIGVNSLVSRRFGERDAEAANHIAGQVFPITFIFGGLFILLSIVARIPILTALGATPDIMEYSSPYFLVINLGSPFIIFTILVSNLLRGSGDAIRPMTFVLAAAITNIVLDPLLIFGIGPFPEMGIRGAAIASVLAQILSSGLGLYCILYDKSAYSIKLIHLKTDIKVLKDIYKVGFPAMLTQFSESICFILFNNVLAAYGSIALAAAGLALRLADLAFMPIMGVADGLLPIVGYNFGARIWKRLWGVVKLSVFSMMLIMTLAVVTLEFLAPYIIPIFNSDPELVAVAIPATRILLLPLPVLSATIMFITTFQGLSRGTSVLVLSLTRQIVFFLPAVYILPFFLGLNGAWLALPISDCLGFLVTGAWLLREHKVQRFSGPWNDLQLASTVYD